MVRYSDEPCLEMVIFLYVLSVLVFICFVMDVGERWGEIRTCATYCLRELKQWRKLLNSLLQIKIVANAYGRPSLYND